MPKPLRTQRTPQALLLLAACTAVLIGALMSGVGHAQVGTTFVVDSIADAADADSADGLCDTGDGSCTLRAAIEQANADDLHDTIEFNIAGQGPHTIAPGSPLPILATQITIDARTQPGFAEFGPRQIELNGLQAGASHGLDITGGEIEIWGLAINDWSGAGIHVLGTGRNTFERNYIGTNVFGSANKPNVTGIDIEGVSANRIAGNVLSGNIEHGLRVIGATAGNQTITSNLIGIDASGQQAVPNGLDGISLNAPLAVVEDNIIAGNLRTGITVFGGSSTDNLIANNYIGTDESGAAAVPNGAGVLIESAPLTQISGNVISGNLSWGVVLTDATQTSISGNHIGLDEKGVAALPNNPTAAPDGGGLLLEQSHESTVTSNLISANGLDGVLISDGDANTFDDNGIGVDINGAPLGNSGNGILIERGDDNTITGSIGPNEIAFNGVDGVAIDQGTGNEIRNNSIHDNTQLGIDLNSDGVTNNDIFDPDGGPNGLQNFPTIWQDQAGNFSGKLRSKPDTAYVIEIYSNTVPDPSGHGEGETLVAVEFVVTDFLGEAEFPVPNVLNPRATATDPNDSTSEFGPLVVHGAPGIALPETWIQLRDETSFVLFSEPVGIGDFTILGNEDAFPGVAVAPDGVFAFGDPALRPPPGQDPGVGGLYIFDSLLADARSPSEALDIFFSGQIGGGPFAVFDLAASVFFGGQTGDGLGTEPHFADVNGDQIIDLVDASPPTAFQATVVSSDPYAGSTTNSVTGERQWYWFVAPGVGTPISPNDPRIATTAFPPGIGADLRAITGDSGFLQLDPAALDNPTQNRFIDLNPGGGGLNGWTTGNSFGVNPVNGATGQVDAPILHLETPGTNPIDDFDVVNPLGVNPNNQLWGDYVFLESPQRRSTHEDEVRVSQTGGFCAGFCAALATMPPTPGGSGSVFVVDLLGLPSLGMLSVTGDEPWAREISGIPAAAGGIAVAVGDLNGDGEADLVIGVPGGRADDLAGAQATKTGVVYVVSGPLRSAPLAAQVSRIITGVDLNEGFGGDVAIGDINQDGVQDILITSRRARPGGNGPQSGALTALLGEAPRIDEVTTDGVLTTITGANLDGAVFIDGAQVETFAATGDSVQVLGAGDAVRVNGVFGTAQLGGGVELAPMWNLTGWRGATPPDVATQSIAGQFSGLFTWDAPAQSFLSFSPALPAALNSLRDLQRGDGAWVFVTDPAGATWLMPDISGPRDVPLKRGFNLVIWTGPSGTSVADAVAGLGGALRSLSLWDAQAQRFLTFNPLLPAALNSAGTLPYGAGMWIDVNADVTWSQPAR